jgi:hypothetical protein
MTGALSTCSLEKSIHVCRYESLWSAVNHFYDSNITIKGRLAEGYSTAAQLSLPLPPEMYFFKPIHVSQGMLTGQVSYITLLTFFREGP